MKKRIFVGGTGRSGTRILSLLIGSHNTISKIPFESRFIIDNHGLINLYSSLTENYSYDQGRIAIRNFEEMMTKTICEKNQSPYLGHPLYKHKDEVIAATKHLISNISEGAFNGTDCHSIDKSITTPFLRDKLDSLNYFISGTTHRVFKKRYQLSQLGYKGILPLENIYIPKYFPDNNELKTILRNYTDSIFGSILGDETMSWCEDTPANIYNMNFLSKIFEGAYFVHVMRHPAGVANSMLKVPWAPYTLKQVCDLLQNLYERSIFSHKLAERNSHIQYKFVKLEDLSDWNNVKLLSNWLGINPDKFSRDVRISTEKMNYFTEEISDENLEYIQNRLQKYIDYFGYTFF
ncbi:MAG: hypothetical protein GVY20_04695 [Bacteroidetes bacterium]|jgi:hypothetical protein|nr:hypothetical protein [Bacteroidota bacterium]